MSDQVTVKITQQEHNLQYRGHRQKSLTDGSAQALRKMLGGVSASPHGASTDTISSVLYQGGIVDSVDKLVGSMEIGYQPMLALFQSFDEPKARQDQKTFFSSVEQGKKELYEKWGNSIPATEVDKLSTKLSSVATRVWYIQIITIRISDQQFPGARQRRVDGKWSCSVKSMTIYRHSPLSDEQIKQLTDVLMGLEKYEGSQNVGRLRKTNTSVYWAVISPKGKVIFKTDLKADNDPLQKE